MLVNKYVGLISLQYYQTIIAYIIDTMPIATPILHNEWNSKVAKPPAHWKAIENSAL